MVVAWGLHFSKFKTTTHPLPPSRTSIFGLLKSGPICLHCPLPYSRRCIFQTGKSVWNSKVSCLLALQQSLCQEAFDWNPPLYCGLQWTPCNHGPLKCGHPYNIQATSKSPKIGYIIQIHYNNEANPLIRTLWLVPRRGWIRGSPSIVIVKKQTTNYNTLYNSLTPTIKTLLTEMWSTNSLLEMPALECRSWLHSIAVCD